MYQNRLKSYRDAVPGDTSGIRHPIAERVEPTIEGVVDTIATTVRQHPLTGIAVGLTVGVILGCLTKRR